MIKIKSRHKFDRSDAIHVVDVLNRKYNLTDGRYKIVEDHYEHYDCQKSLTSSIPGIGHPIPAIGRMELEIYNLIDWNGFLENLFKFFGLKLKKAIKEGDQLIYKPDGSTFTLHELEIINNFIRDELKIVPTEIEAAVVRSYIIGNIISAMQEAKEAKKVFDFAALPKTVVEMAKKYKLTPQEINSVNYAISNVGNQIAGITDEARKIIAQKVIEARFEGRSHEELALDLFHEVTDTDRNLNRDWRRVSITEASSCTSNGFIEACNEGEKVIGVSQPGACEYCMDKINGKVYTVRKNPPPDYRNLDPTSKEYKEIAKIWETQIWFGKTNIGRSSSLKKKSSNGDYELRDHHDQWMPTIPAHPFGRCYWRKL